MTSTDTHCPTLVMGASCLKRSAIFVCVFLLADFILLYGLTWYSPSTFRFVFSLQIHEIDPADHVVPDRAHRQVTKMTSPQDSDKVKKQVTGRKRPKINESDENVGRTTKDMFQYLNMGQTKKSPKQITGKHVTSRPHIRPTATQEIHLLESISRPQVLDSTNVSRNTPGNDSLSKRNKETYAKLKEAEDSFLRKAFHPIMTAEDAEIMKDILTIFIKTIEDAGLTCIMYGGTLLGSYRHHGFIPWDDDIDLLLRASERDNLKRAVSKLGPQYTLYTKHEYRWKFYSNSSRNVSGVPWKYPFLDLCFFLENEKAIWDIDPQYGVRFRYDKSMVFPVIDRPFENLTLKAPKDTMGSLAKNYNLDICQTNRYIHKIENWAKEKTVRVECEKLWDKFPFVFREDVDDETVLETLRFGNQTLNSVILA